MGKAGSGMDENKLKHKIIGTMKTGLFFRIGSIHYSLRIKEDITAYESAILAEFLTMYTPDRILDIDGKAEFINERMDIIGRHFQVEIQENDTEIKAKEPRGSWTLRILTKNFKFKK